MSSFRAANVWPVRKQPVKSWSDREKGLSFAVVSKLFAHPRRKSVFYSTSFHETKFENPLVLRFASIGRKKSPLLTKKEQVHLLLFNHSSCFHSSLPDPSRRADGPFYHFQTIANCLLYSSF